MRKEFHCPICNKPVTKRPLILTIDEKKNDKIFHIVATLLCNDDCLVKAVSLGSKLLDELRYDRKDRVVPAEIPPEIEEKKLHCNNCDKPFKIKHDHVLLMLEKYQGIGQDPLPLSYEAYCSLKCLRQKLENLKEKLEGKLSRTEYCPDLDLDRLQQKFDKKIYGIDGIFANQFDIEIPIGSETEKNLLQSLNKIKCCYYCHAPLFFDEEPELFSHLMLDPKPVRLENVAACSECSNQINEAIQDAIDQISARKKRRFPIE